MLSLVGVGVLERLIWFFAAFILSACFFMGGSYFRKFLFI